MGLLFHAFGLLPTSKCIVTSALDLTGQYAGQSKSKMEDVMNTALGGILFIDEAYNLGKGGFGNEVQDKLLQMLTEDKYRHKVVVVLAGYSDKMNEMCNNNAGFKSRFNQVIDFPDWKNENLVNLVLSLAKKEQPSYIIEDVECVKKHLNDGFSAIRSNDTKSWANARDAVSLYKYIKDSQLDRLSESAHMHPSATVICSNDVCNGVLEFTKTRPPIVVDPMAGLGLGLGLGLPGMNGIMRHGNGVMGVDMGLELGHRVQPQCAHSHSHQMHVATAVEDVELELELEVEVESDADANQVEYEDMKQYMDTISAAMEAAKSKADTKHGDELLVEMQRVKAILDEMKRVEDEIVAAKAALDEEERLRLLKIAAEKKRLLMLKLQKEKEQQLLQEKLRRIGNCAYGFQWIDKGSYYQCSGGCRVTYDQLK